MVVLGVPPDRQRWSSRSGTRARRRSTTVSCTTAPRSGSSSRAASTCAATDVVPRGHPGDGRAEVQVYASRAASGPRCASACRSACTCRTRGSGPRAGRRVEIRADRPAAVRSRSTAWPRRPPATVVGRRGARRPLRCWCDLERSIWVREAAVGPPRAIAGTVAAAHRYSADPCATEAEAVGVYPVEQFTDDEEAVLRPYFTNLDRPVFGVVNLPEVVKGALFAALLAQPEEPAPPVPRRVRRRSRPHRRPHRRRDRRAASAPRSSTTASSSNTATTPSRSSAACTSRASRRRTSSRRSSSGVA